MLNTRISKMDSNEFHKMRELSCAICGSPANIPFRGDYICRDCLEYIKALALVNR